MKYLMLFLLLVPLAAGEGIIAQSPGENVTIETGKEPFTFAADQQHRLTRITTCDIVVNGTAYKTLTVNNALEGTTRRVSQRLQPGTYAWQIVCGTEEGNLTSGTRTVHVTEAARSDVTVTSSGVTRGSLLHSLEMTNSPDQEPISVPNVRPGDFLGITVKQEPSTFTREFYIKSRLIEEEKSYLRLTSDLEEFRLYLNENTTLPVGSTDVVVYFANLEGTRADFIVYPSATVPEAEPEEEPPEEEPEERPGEQEPEAEPQPPAPEPEQPPAPTERQGFFSWLLSLMTRLFGA